MSSLFSQGVFSASLQKLINIFIRLSYFKLVILYVTIIFNINSNTSNNNNTHTKKNYNDIINNYNVIFILVHTTRTLESQAFRKYFIRSTRYKIFYYD